MQNYFPFDESRSIDLISMGRVAVDLYAEQVYARLEDAQTFRKYLGGCAGNIAVGTSRIGLTTSMLSCVGQDDLGKFLINSLQQEGVNTDLLQICDQHLTGLVLLGVNPPDRFPLIFYRENCADMQLKPKHCDANLFKQSKALLITGTCLSTESMRETTYHAIKLAKSVGTAIILDIDFRPVLWKLTDKGNGESRYVSSKHVSQQYQQIISQCDLIVGTEEECMIAGGSENISDALVQLRQLSTAPIILKTGEKGCQIFLDDLTTPLLGNAFPIKVLNVLGAGDAFMSGFLRGWLRQQPWETSANYANACGAIVVSRHGCAPAMPSFEEMQYFITHYDKEKDITNSPQLNQLHSHIMLNTTKSLDKISSRELFILAFDHRKQFEASISEYNKNKDLIKTFKRQVFKGFDLVHQQDVKEDYSSNNLGILIDPLYGEEIIKNAADNNVNIGVPIEAAGSMPVNWISHKPLYHEILQRPSNWFVKVLWQFHTDLSKNCKQVQIEQLQNLARACDHLNRKLMVELIIPPQYASTGDAVCQAIQVVYTHSIYPCWWKLGNIKTAAEWQQVGSIIKDNDPAARIIILGGACNNGETDRKLLEKQFAAVKATGIANGFAIGRSIFWKTWQDFLMGKVQQKEIPSMIAQQYRSFINLWKKC